MPDVEPYDAAVIGGAVCMGRWTKLASSFVHHHQAQLLRVPRSGCSAVGPWGPSPTLEAAELAELRTLLNVRGDAGFDGTIDAEKPSLSERLMMKAVRAPYGDHRRWDRIDEWAASIAASLDASATQLRIQ